MAMNELSWNGVFVKRGTDDCIHRDIGDFLTWSMLLFKFKDINGNEVQYLLISFFFWFLKFEFHTYICGQLYPSERFSFNISEFIVMFECSLTYCVL